MLHVDTLINIPEVMKVDVNDERHRGQCERADGNVSVDEKAQAGDDLYDACDAMDIPTEAATSEVGPGQFEINLVHVADALKAAVMASLNRVEPNSTVEVNIEVEHAPRP